MLKFENTQLVKTLKSPILSQTKMGKNKGGLSIFVLFEAKKLTSSKRPKTNIKMSSILISIIFPPDKVPAEKLGEKAIAPAKKIKDKILITFLKFIDRASEGSEGEEEDEVLFA